MSDIYNINIQENIEDINIVTSEITDVYDINIAPNYDEVTINVTEQVTQINLNEVTSIVNDAPNDSNAYVRSGLSWIIGYTKSAIDTLLGNKVDKESGKGLSTNDYTTTEKTKLATIATGATANDTDANLKNRANHTGTQLSSTISDFATAVSNLITNKVDKITGYSLTKNDLTDTLKTAYDNAVSSLTTLLATGSRLITSAEITKLSNTSGTNTGDQNLTGLIPYTGATNDVDLDSKNLKVNNVFDGFTSIVASGTLITLTINSTPSYLVTGSGGQTIKLPNATTLQNGTCYIFNNNQSSGTISVNNNSNTLVKSVPSGGNVIIELIDNSIAAGSWDSHSQAPSNVSWSTNTFDYPGSITSATWNGVNIADNRIASAANWNAKEDSANKSTSTADSASSVKFPVWSAIVSYLANFVPTSRTVNAKALSSNITLTTADIADSSGKRYQSENQNTFNDATSSIQTQLNNRINLILRINANSTTVSSTTNNTILANIPLPVGTLGLNDCINLDSVSVWKTGVLGTTNVRVYISTTYNSTTSGATLIGLFSMTNLLIYGKFRRSYPINNGSLIYPTVGNVTGNDDANTSSAATINTVAVNNTTTQYWLVIALQLGSASDSAYINGIRVTN